MNTNWKSRLTLKHDCRIKPGPNNTLEVFYDGHSYRLEIPLKDISLAMLGDPKVINKVARALLGSDVVGYKRLSLIQTFNIIRKNGLYLQKEPPVPKPTSLPDMQIFLDSVLKSAKIVGTGLYDPLVVIHRFLDSPWHFNEVHIFYDKLKEVDRNATKLEKISRVYLWQHVYISRNTVSSLSPALKYKAFTPILQNYIHKEMEHVSLIEDCLNCLPHGPGEELIFWETRKIVANLRNVATFNPFAFVVAIALFEEGDNTTDHNLGNLLSSLSDLSPSGHLLKKYEKLHFTEYYQKIVLELAASLGPIGKNSVINGINTFYSLKSSIRGLYRKLIKEFNKV